MFNYFPFFCCESPYEGVVYFVTSNRDTTVDYCGLEIGTLDFHTIHQLLGTLR